MSRTVRRKNDTHEYYWVLIEFTHVDNIPKDLEKYDKVVSPRWVSSYDFVDIHYDPKSKLGKKLINRYHSDVNRYHGGKGPGWFYNLYCQKPYRQEARKEIKKSLLDDEYEVILPSKPKAVYWD